MKIIILSTILLFCILPVANANNGNVKIKFIRESVTFSKMSRSTSEQNLSGVGFEFYGNLSKDSGWVVNQVKSNTEKRLEEQLAKDQNKQLDFHTKLRVKKLRIWKNDWK